MSATIADFAGLVGLSSSDLAFLAGINESTVSRLWLTEDWPDTIKGKTLQSLMAILPGLGEYFMEETLRRRRSRLFGELENEGLVVDQDSFQRAVMAEKIPEQLLASALDAALHVMKRNPADVASRLTRFWNRAHDRALTCLWRDPAAGGVFRTPSPLVGAAEDLIPKLADSPYSYHAIVGHATLAHHVAKATGRLVVTLDEANLTRRTVMAYRSAMIGHIIQTGDLVAVRRYAQAIQRNTLLQMVERWSFPTYNRDAMATTDFSLPGSVLLRNTVEELLVDLDSAHEAYFGYLVGVAVPLMLCHDRTLGLQAPRVYDIVNGKRAGCADATVRKSASALLESLRKSA